MRDRYRVFDRWHGRWLMGFQIPIEGMEAVVTMWSDEASDAMLFPGPKSARCAIAELGAASQYAVINQKGLEV